MKILRATGIGVLFVILALFMPAVFTELSKTLIVILQSSAEAFAAAGALASKATPR